MSRNKRGQKYTALIGHCCMCHSYFDADKFYNDPFRSGGISSRCIPCDNARGRARSKKKGRGGMLGTPVTNRPFAPGGTK